MNSTLRTVLLSLGAIAIFALALVLLDRELGSVSVEDVHYALHTVSTLGIITSIVLTIISYLVLSLYDRLSLRLLQHPLPYLTILKGSFLGYALSHSLGFSMVTGGAARFQVYSRKGLSSVELIQVTAFNALIFWVGVISLLAALAIGLPQDISPFVRLSPSTVRYIGFGIVGAVCCVGVTAHSLSLKVEDWEVHIPPWRLLAEGILLAIVDWSLAAAAAWILLPNNQINFASFLAVFVSAQVLGVVSHVPAGIGIFEAGMLTAFSGQIPADQLLGSLLLFRVIYYLFPLTTAFGILIVDEFRTRSGLRKVAGILTHGTLRAIPSILSLIILISGVWLVVSGVRPPSHHRWHWISEIIPLSIIEASHFAGSIIGVCLIILARGIQRRIDGAYYLVSIALAVASVVTYLKAGHIQESLILIVVLLLLYLARKNFYRRGSLFTGDFSVAHLVVLGVTVSATFWLLGFSFRHVEYSNALWWEFSIDGHAPRSLRAFVGVCGVLMSWGWLRLLSPRPADPEAPTEAEMQKALELARSSPRTSSYLALLGDKYFLFNQNREAFVMFGLKGKTCVALGDPVGAEEYIPEMILDFVDYCDLHGFTMVFYQAHHKHLTAYLDLGLNLVKLGEEAMVALDSFTIDGQSNSGLRRARNKLLKEGYSFRVIPESEVSARMADFERVSNEWIGDKEAAEKGFSLGAFEPDYLKYFPFAIVEYQGVVLAFANILSGAGKEELSVDLMRYGNDAPRGIMDFMFTELFIWGRENGYKTFNLGMAPLSGLERHQLAPLWNKVGSFIFRHGEHFYNFQGLRQYKEKFDPKWEPRYLVTAGAFQLPTALTSIAALISGGFRRIFSK